MKRILLLLTLAVSCATCVLAADNIGNENNVAPKKIKPSHATIKEIRPVSGFDGIEVSAGIMAIVTQGDTWSVEVTADSNLIEHVKTNKFGGILHISYKGIDKIANNFNRTIVHITCPELKEITANSTADVLLRGTFHGDKLNVKISSAASLAGDIDYSVTKFNISSAGDMSISGHSEKCSINASSAAAITLSGSFTCLEIDASSAAGCAFLPHIQGEELAIRANSSAYFKGLATYDNMHINASSSAAVVLSGECPNSTVTAGSNSQVDITNMPAEYCNVKASSGANVKVLVSNTLTAKISSGADIRYFGEPLHVNIKE